MRNLFIIVVAVVNFLTLTVASADPIAAAIEVTNTKTRAQVVCETKYNLLKKAHSVAFKERQSIIKTCIKDKDLKCEDGFKAQAIQSKAREELRNFDMLACTTEMDSPLVESKKMENPEEDVFRGCATVTVAVECKWWELLCNDDIHLRWKPFNENNLTVSSSNRTQEIVSSTVFEWSVKQNSVTVCGSGYVVVYEEGPFGGQRRVDQFKVSKNRGNVIKAVRGPQNSNYMISWN